MRITHPFGIGIAQGIAGGQQLLIGTPQALHLDVQMCHPGLAVFYFGAQGLLLVIGLGAQRIHPLSQLGIGGALFLKGLNHVGVRPAGRCADLVQTCCHPVHGSRDAALQFFDITHGTVDPRSSSSFHARRDIPGFPKRIAQAAHFPDPTQRNK
jgi:hypothetical protein